MSVKRSLMCLPLLWGLEEKWFQDWSRCLLCLQCEIAGTQCVNHCEVSKFLLRYSSQICWNNGCYLKGIEADLASHRRLVSITLSAFICSGEKNCFFLYRSWKIQFPGTTSLWCLLTDVHDLSNTTFETFWRNKWLHDLCKWFLLFC